MSGNSRNAASPILAVERIHFFQRLSKVLVEKCDLVIVSWYRVSVAIERVNFAIVVLEESEVLTKVAEWLEGVLEGVRSYIRINFTPMKPNDWCWLEPVILGLVATPCRRRPYELLSEWNHI
jgi:hypothetical protein